MGHISEFNAIFTDAMPPESLKKLLDDHNVRMYLADPV
jgi:DeoR family glycerol-3-phosphate regulon repressor